MNRFPQDDEYSLQQGDDPRSCANLDIFYPCRFVQNEELHLLVLTGTVTVYQTMYTPVLPGTMSGWISLDDQLPPVNGFTFTVDASGKFDVKRIGEEDRPEMTLEEMSIFICSWETNLNCATGILELHHHTGGLTPKMVVSYEYNKEE